MWFFFKKIQPKSVFIFGMIPIDLITMAAGGVSGFIFRYMSERAKEKHEQFKMVAAKANLDITIADAAAKREPLDMGKWVRRVIVVCVLFGVILAPFILAMLGKGTIVEVSQIGSSYLFGLFNEGNEIAFVELPSYLLMPEVRQSLMAIIGYYFGSATAGCKS